MTHDFRAKEAKVIIETVRRMLEIEHLWANHNQIIYNHSLNKLRGERERESEES